MRVVIFLLLGSRCRFFILSFRLKRLRRFSLRRLLRRQFGKLKRQIERLPGFLLRLRHLPYLNFKPFFIMSLFFKQLRSAVKLLFLPFRNELAINGRLLFLKNRRLIFVFCRLMITLTEKRLGLWLFFF